MTTASIVLIATDLTADAEPALVRGRAHADAIGAAWVVCHVIPDVLRHHPLVPTRDENDVALASDVEKKAADLVTEQVQRVLGASPDEYRAIIEIGTPEDEIVRIAEAERASLVVIGAKPRHAAERILGHVAERVVRYVHTSVLVARPGIPTGKIVVATDFTEASLPAVRFGGTLIAKAGVDGTLLHVMQLPSATGTALGSVSAALGSSWIPPSKETIAQLEALGRATLDGLAKQYGFARTEQVEGDPAEMIVTRARAMNAEMIVMGSRGRSGLSRLVLGSTAEKVIRTSETSVLVVR
ncbi:MAG: Universal stress protein family [Labilithrix sp.]|nr:Universal stress protein family [Labilithrix sp.]